MFADPQICDLSHKLGLLSLGATDYQIKHLAAIYWWTIEFGITIEKGKRKFYGAGIASSITEIDNMLACKDIRKLDLMDSSIIPNEFVVQDVQPTFYLSESFESVCDSLDDYAKVMGKSFHL